VLDEHLTKVTQEDKLQALLINLTRVLEDDSSNNSRTDQIEQRFYDFIRQDSGTERGDIARDVLRFIQEVIGEDTRVIRTLKACNQGIIAPAVMQLRMNICPHLKFKDGGKSIFIHYLEITGYITTFINRIFNIISFVRIFGKGLCDRYSQK
jgi:hypothetical protein